MNTDKIDSISAVSRVLHKEPLLGFHGFETGERARMTSDEGLVQFQMACEWISRQTRIDKIKAHATSYTYKHAVERDFHCYIASGMWACAAIHLGVLYRRYRKNTDIICNLPKPIECVQMSENEYADMKERYLKRWPNLMFMK